MSMSAVPLLLGRMVKEPYLWLEDVFSTGVLAKSIEAVHIHEQHLFDDIDPTLQLWRMISRKTSDLTARNSPWISIHCHNYKNVRMLWKEIILHFPENHLDHLENVLENQEEKQE